MAALTEKDLEAKQAKNAKLRERIADAEAKSAAAIQEQNTTIEGTALDAETARLEARLAAAQEAAKVSNIKSGAAGPLAAVTEQLALAQAGSTPVGVTVDTNADKSAPDNVQTYTVDANTNGGNS